MRKLQILLILSFFSVQGFAAGCLDGSEPVKSISADGTYFVYNCGGGSTENSSSSSSSSNTKALAGIDIENDPNIDFFKPPLKPYPTDKLYWFGRYWQIVDFNKDGYSDVIYIGTMNPNNVEVTGEDTSGLCGSDVCKGYKPLPSLYLGGANKKLTYAPELIIDNREDSGMSLGRQILVADYNNDNILDFYVADHGIGGGGHNGVRDSYFLSQSNGTWVESSETHLSHSNFVVFDHGGATGDIDNDGDMDVVITELNGKTGTALWCLMNDGTGYLKSNVIPNDLTFPFRPWGSAENHNKIFTFTMTDYSLNNDSVSFDLYYVSCANDTTFFTSTFKIITTSTNNTITLEQYYTCPPLYGNWWNRTISYELEKKSNEDIQILAY